jgi:hypothetical protein
MAEDIAEFNPVLPNTNDTFFEIPHASRARAAPQALRAYVGVLPGITRVGGHGRGFGHGRSRVTTMGV